MDAPLGISTGAADIFANTGGVMEAALRTVWEIVTETPFPFPEPARRRPSRASKA
jgi:NADP-reducing hydrogenase subunit HndD